MKAGVAFVVTALLPTVAYAALSYGNSDGTASMSVSSWGNNYVALSGTQRSYAGKPVYTQGQAHNAVGSEGWKRHTENTTSVKSQSRRATIINNNYTFKHLTGASVRLCTDVPLWFDPCGNAVRFNR